MATYPTDAPEKALLSEGSRTKCARRDRKVPRESVSFLAAKDTKDAKI